MSTMNNSMTALQAVNLLEQFGHRYQIGYEESYYAEYGPNSRVDDPELQVLYCHHGHVFLWGGQRLAASTDTRGAIANRLAALDCCKVEQDGDDGVTVSFDVGDFRTVAGLIKPRGRRSLDPARRKAFIEAGRTHRYCVASGQMEISSNDTPTFEVQVTLES